MAAIVATPPVVEVFGRAGTHLRVDDELALALRPLLTQVVSLQYVSDPFGLLPLFVVGQGVAFVVNDLPGGTGRKEEVYPSVIDLFYRLVDERPAGIIENQVDDPGQNGTEDYDSEQCVT